MGLKPEVFDALRDIIGAAKVQAAVERKAETGHLRNFTPTPSPDGEERKADYPEVLVIDWSMIVIQTGERLMAPYRKAKEEKDKDEDDREDYIENAAGEEIVGPPSVMPLISHILRTLFDYLRVNTSIRRVVWCADKYGPTAKDRTGEKRAAARKVDPYPARSYRVNIRTANLEHTDTGEVVPFVNYSRLIYNRTSLMSQLIRALLFQLANPTDTPTSPFRSHDVPRDVCFTFDFSDTSHVGRTGVVMVRPVCLDICTDSNACVGPVHDAEEGPVCDVGEGDVAIVTWVKRLRRCATVLSGDGDQINALTLWMEQEMQACAADKQDDKGLWDRDAFASANIPTVYLLKNRDAGYSLQNTQTSMYNINHAVELMHAHGWTGDKLALLSILATNDYYIDKDKAVLMPSIGLGCICQVLRAMSQEQVANTLISTEHFQLFCLWVWMAKYCVTQAPTKKAQKVRERAFQHPRDIVTKVTAFNVGWATLVDETKTAKAAREKMGVLRHTETLNGFRRLIRENIEYWRLLPPRDRFKPAARYVFADTAEEAVAAASV